MDKVFDKWKEKLLDIGKGNRLLNFKETAKTVEILAPDPEILFNKITNGELMTFYNIDNFASQTSSGLALLDEKNNAGGGFLSRQQIEQALSDKISSKQLLPFKKGALLQKTLKDIKKTASEAILEKGINILYMAFGFLKWKENEKADNYFSSPILLIPINLEGNERKNTIYTVSEYDDEINLNPTLVYVMKNQYGIKLPEFQDEEHSEESLTEYLKRIEDLVCDKGWTISENVFIGTFSFLKLNMYKDLEENEDVILQNENIKKILNKEQSQDNIRDIDIDEYFKEGRELELHNVVDADSSQMQAIIRAKSGKSFVLQGPPGTGKSQTITNLVAEFLFENKKVLFVSEKLEALNVVYNNLKKVGLEDFCLELHSHKTNKKEVINELYRVLVKNKSFVSTRASEELSELKKSKEQLDDYDSQLHKVIPVIDRTTYQILGAVSKYRNYPEVEFAIENIEERGIDYLKSSVEIIDNYATFTKEIGEDYHKNAWYGFIGSEFTYQDKLSLKRNLNESVDYLTEIVDLKNELNSKIGLSLNSITDLFDNENLVNEIANLEFYNKNLFNKGYLNELAEKVVLINKIDNEIKTNYEELSKTFSDEIFELNLNDLYLRFKNDYVSSFRVLNSKYRRDKKVLKQYLVNASKKLSYKQIVDVLKLARDIHTSREELEKLRKEISSIISYKEGLVKRGRLEKQIIQLNSLLKKDLNVLTKLDEEQFKILQDNISDYMMKFDGLKPKQAYIDNLKGLFDKDRINFDECSVEDLLNFVSNCQFELNNLDNWIKFCDILSKLKEFDLLGFIDKAIEEEIKPSDLSNSFKLLFYKQWVYYILSKNNILHEFSRPTQDANVEKFKEKDKLKFEISKAEIISKLSAERPSLNSLISGSQVSMLVREASKKRRQKPVRVLLQSISELVQTLKPCFLMSPLSVSTYLSEDSCKFDVVIFDEASQIFPWDAVGAIYRAKQTIVVGDSKQMPPSNFFKAEIDDEKEDEDEIDGDDSLDFESILDICASSFNQERLLWHYRSRTEDLITFSNKNFYDGDLVTFPSTKKDNKDTGVDFYYVENGVFDRKTKKNLIEANRVVDLVFEHFENYPNRSLGVVAFSISQQAAIESILQERREKNDKYAQFFDSNRNERFFVKNLETVQGDERDTIIFSVAYAKDDGGKFIHNFGPLNKKGGERRLNVAITRAKYNIKLVSSIRSFDIDLSKTSSVGARLLKEYLAYAETGYETEINKNESLEALKSDGKFEDEVFDALVEAGFNVVRNVGSSSYKIDFGIRHPSNSDFVLAIECDGDNYHSARTTRDRDRLRQEVLERFGWRYYRIWSTDWFVNKQNEKKKLIQTVQNAIDYYNNENHIDSFQPDDQQNFIVEKAESNILSERFPVYNIFSAYEWKVQAKKLITFDNIIYSLVETEGPITEELLLKKTVALLGGDSVTADIKEKFKQKMEKHADITKVKNYYVVNINKPIEMRLPKEGNKPRDVLLIPTDELSMGMLKIIEFYSSIDQEELYKTMSTLLCFGRFTERIKAKLDQALNAIIRKGMVKEADGKYSLS